MPAVDAMHPNPTLRPRQAGALKESMRHYYQDSHATIYHADARDAADVLPAVDLLLTDPSYGQNFTSNRVPGRKLRPTHNDGVRQSVRLYRQVLPLIRAEHVLWFCHWKAFADVSDILGQFYRPRGLLVWDKGHPGLGDRTHPGTDYELIASAGNGALAVPRPGSIIRGHKPVPPRRRRHVHEKPVSLGRHLLDMFGATSMADTFFGSGNFLVAAKERGISAYGIDLDESSCETAARALEETRAGVVGSFSYPVRGTLDSVRMPRTVVRAKERPSRTANSD
jgi:DNA modification methylase